MKSIITLCSLLFFVLISAQSYAQSEQKEIRKEVKLTEENGVKTLIIITTENGKTNTQTFIGPDADAKLAQMEQELPKESGEKSTVKVYPDGRKEIRIEKAVIKKKEDDKKEDDK